RRFGQRWCGGRTEHKLITVCNAHGDLNPVSLGRLKSKSTRRGCCRLIEPVARRLRHGDIGHLARCIDVEDQSDGGFEAFCSLPARVGGFDKREQSGWLEHSRGRVWLLSEQVWCRHEDQNGQHPKRTHAAQSI